jgi:ABC-2 type transport system permease protein
LIWYFVQRQLTRSYRNYYLGIVWMVLGPLLMVALLTLVFSEMIGLRFRESDSVANFGLYLYCGLIPFLAYTDTVSKSVSIIRNNAALVRRVVFPLEVLPLSTAATSIINQMFGIGALTALVVLLEHRLHLTMLLLPLVMIPQFLFNLGLGYVAAVAGTYLPDVQETIKVLVRSTFFITPIIWPADRVGEDHPLRFVVDYNPLALLVEAYRNLVLDGTLPGGKPFVCFSLFAGVLCVVGFAVFIRVKKRFADLV